MRPSQRNAVCIGGIIHKSEKPHIQFRRGQWGVRNHAFTNEHERIPASAFCHNLNNKRAGRY